MACQGPSSSGSGGTSLSFCGSRHVYSETQLMRVPGLIPSFDDTVIVHLEDGSQAAGSGDSSGSGLDSIHYRVANPQTLTFGFQSHLASGVSLEDMQGNVKASLASGQTNVPIVLEAGDYLLEIQSSGSGSGDLVVQPSGCGSVDAAPSLSLRASMTTSYEHPGVYIQELPSAQVVTPAATSIAAFVGAVPQGPLNQAVLLSSYNEYTQYFGGLDASYPLGFAVYEFFSMGGLQAYVVGSSNQANPSADDLLGLTGGGGLQALEGVAINLLSFPDASNLDPQEALTLAQAATDRALAEGFIVLLDPPQGLGIQGIEEYANENLNGLPGAGHAALYFPEITVLNPLDSKEVTLGPSGAVAGAYALTDLNIGVWANPAGITNGALPMVVGLPYALNSSQLSILDLAGVNPIWEPTGYGPVIWGANSLSLDASERDISVRRLLLFITQSLNQNLEWVVFEPDNEETWATLTQVTTNFLTSLWSAGAFIGATPADAFYVTCDFSNNSPEDILNGVINLEVGFAAVMPAEYLVINLSFEVQESD